MKNSMKFMVCALLLLPLTLFSKNKDRVVVVNNSNTAIYCDPNTGTSKTIGAGQSACVVAQTSKANLKSLKICTKDALSRYNAAKSAGPASAAAGYAILQNDSVKVNVSSENIIVVTKTGDLPSAKKYATKADYLKANSKAAQLVSCGQAS